MWQKYWTQFKKFRFKNLVFIQYILIVFLSPPTSPRSSVPTQTPTNHKKTNIKQKRDSCSVSSHSQFPWAWLSLSFPLSSLQRWWLLDAVGWASHPSLVLCLPLLGRWARRMGAEFWHQLLSIRLYPLFQLYLSYRISAVSWLQILWAVHQASVLEPSDEGWGAIVYVFILDCALIGQGLFPLVLWPWLVC